MYHTLYQHLRPLNADTSMGVYAREETMQVLRHTVFANGHVEYEALEGQPDQGPRHHLMALFEDGTTTRVTVTKDTGTVSTYTKVDGLVHGKYPISNGACRFAWSDGWASGHRCIAGAGHSAYRHRCPCDATTGGGP